MTLLYDLLRVDDGDVIELSLTWSSLVVKCCSRVQIVCTVV